MRRQTYKVLKDRKLPIRAKSIAHAVKWFAFKILTFFLQSPLQGLGYRKERLNMLHTFIFFVAFQKHIQSRYEKYFFFLDRSNVRYMLTTQKDVTFRWCDDVRKIKSAVNCA